MKSPHAPESYHLKTDSSLAKANAEELENGVTVSVESLYRLRREALHLTASPADAVNSLFPGAFQAIFHGRGLEFDEVRAYQWGDDHRNVDWRVTARTGHMHTKLYHQERERTLYLLIDAGKTMHFGTRQQFKWVLAARLAAIFAWLAAENGDRVGCVLFGHKKRCEIIPPGLGQAALLRIFKLFSQQKAPPNQNRQATAQLADALGHLRHLAQSDALIVVISDFLQLSQGSKQRLADLNRHHELAMMMTSDPLEQQLPQQGSYAVSDGQSVCRFNAQQPELAKNYANRFNQHCETLQQLFQRYRIPLLQFSTEQDIYLELRQIFRSVQKNTTYLPNLSRSRQSDPITADPARVDHA